MSQQTTEQRLTAAQQLMDSAKTKRIQAETRLESAKAAREKHIARCESMGFSVAELDERITAYQQEIEQGIQQLESALNGSVAPAAPAAPAHQESLPF